MAVACIGCDSPRVAVCIVGQLRTGARVKLARQVRKTWSNVGDKCVDIFFDVGIEARAATANHRAAPAQSYDNASLTASILRPIEWRVSTHHFSSPEDQLTCASPDDARGRGDKLCHKRPWTDANLRGGTRENCSDSACTHCAATGYYAQAQRLAGCAAMVQSAARRLRRSYEYFVFHRPDMWLYGLPNYAEWQFSDAGLSRTALFCDASKAMANDFLAIMAYRHISVVSGLNATYMACQSRRDNLRLGCNARGYPSWHQSECILHTAFARHGIRTETAPWKLLIRSCRIVRDKDERWSVPNRTEEVLRANCLKMRSTSPRCCAIIPCHSRGAGDDGGGRSHVVGETG